MQAVLIGSAVYRETHPDVDLVADQEFANWFINQHQPESVVENQNNRCYTVRALDTIFEITVPHPGTAYALVLELAGGRRHDTDKIHGIEVSFASLPVLAALKKAHLIIPHKWEKHIREYGKLKELLKVDVFLPGDYGPGVYLIYQTHRKEVLAGAKKHPKLNVQKDAFFEDAKFKIFDHDSIHKAVALGDVPGYTMMNDGEVWCSKAKWDALTDQQKLNCVMEEASVLALERSIIPALYLNNGYHGTQWAYEFALQKICTTITSGWFRDYSIEHFNDAVRSRPDYVKAFFSGVKNKTVKLLKPEVVS